MAFPVTFYIFGKYPNSTRIPTQYTPKKEFTCELNDTCAFTNPVLHLGVTAVPPVERDFYRYNYCYIPIFERYYFIDEWTWDGGMWSALCHVDVLASFRSAILNSSFYVMRAAYTNTGGIIYNPVVSDGTYPTTAAAPTYNSSAAQNPYTGVEGVYIAGVINNESNNGAVTYYAFNKIGFRNFCRALYNYSSGWLNIDVTEISENLQKALVNPFQYVVSCIYLPINVQAIIDLGTEAVTDIKFGWWSVRVAQGARIVNTTMAVRRVTSLSIPRHPLSNSRGTYLNLSPYSIYTLRYYPYGTINIDSEALAGWNTIDLYSDLDVCTGKGILNICVNGFNNPIRTIEAQVGVSIPTASLQTSYSNIVTGKTALMAAGAEAIGNLNKVSTTRPHPAQYEKSLKGAWNYLKDSIKGVTKDVETVVTGGDIKQTATNILNTAVAASTTAEIQGMQGAGSLYNQQTLTLSGRFLPIVEEDLRHTGRPFMQNVILNTLSGFCIVKDGDIDINALDKERQAIQAFLEGGFFIE